MFSCGFDSVPTRRFVQEEAKRVFGTPALRVKGRVRDMRGTLSGGTAASAKATFDAVAKDLSLVAILKDAFALTPGFKGPKQPPGSKPAYEEDLQSWAAPFMMALINTAQHPSFEHADGLSVLEGVRLRRNGADRCRREGRGQRQAGDGRKHRKDRPRCTEAGRRAIGKSARTASMICSMSPSRPMAAGPRGGEGRRIPATARRQR